MKKQILFMVLGGFVLLTTQIPVLANDWFNRYDANHDRQWNYEEYQKAQMEWLKHHKHHMSDKELREYYARLDRDRNGFLTAEEARRAHMW